MTPDLLAIDVAQELRALSRDQLRASWQVPAELARLGLRLGAVRITAETARRGFGVRCTGATVDEGLVRELAAAIDIDGAPECRHRALLRLEAAGAQTLLWVVGVERSTVTVESCGDGRWSRLAVAEGGGAKLHSAPAEADESWFEVRLSAAGFDGRRAADWLRAATRFAPVPVDVDGAAAPRAFPAALLETRCREPLPARLAVTLAGDAPQLWLLQHGVLSTRATVPGWPPFTAAVELAGLVRPQATPDELREAVTPHLVALGERVVDLALAACERLPELSEPVRRRLVGLLLAAARVRLRRDRIFGAKLLREEGGAGGGVSWRSLEELERLVQAGSPPPAVLGPDGDSRPRNGDGPPVLRLSTEERALVGELLGVRLQRPREAADRRRAWPARLPGWLRPARWWPARRLRIVPSDELLEAELGLLAVLNRQLAAPLEARLVAGDGAILRRRNRLLLPRHNPLVARGLRLVSRDRDQLYPVALALLGEEARPSAALRERWRRRCLSATPTRFGAETTSDE